MCCRQQTCPGIHTYLKGIMCACIHLCGCTFGWCVFVCLCLCGVYECVVCVCLCLCGVYVCVLCVCVCVCFGVCECVGEWVSVWVHVSVSDPRDLWWIVA